MTYLSRAFHVTTFDQAKHVVLIDDPDNPKKFEQQTNFLIDKLKTMNIINSQSKILDFGCGMGRVSKPLIDEFGCSVVGMDISENMKKFAVLYVCQPKLFSIIEQFPEQSSIDLALAILVLQHTENPADDIKHIFNSLRPNGYFILLNEHRRMVPVDVDVNGFVVWNDDNFDVSAEMKKYSALVQSFPYIDNRLQIEIYQKQ